MLRYGLIVLLFLITTGYTFFGWKPKPGGDTPETKIAQTLIAQTDTLYNVAAQLSTALQRNATQSEVQKLFLRTRLSYKKIEWAAEYFTPDITRIVNGPPVPEVEPAEKMIFPPAGLQVMEALLFPKYDGRNKAALMNQTEQLQTSIAKYRAYFENVPITNWQVFDAARQEGFRIITLGITGFDNPLTLHSMQECEVALAGMQAAVAVYPETGNRAKLMEKIKTAKKYLHHNPNFNTFNRAEFITAYGNPISAGIQQMQAQLHIPVVKYNRLLNQDAATLFDKNAFNPNAYGTDLDAITPQKIALGKRLFFDKALSVTGTRSCASCHKPEKAFTDGLVKNKAIHGKALLPRNTPTLINAALQPAQFYDLRANRLEDQVIDVIQNKTEMQGSIGNIFRRLRQDKMYRRMVLAAYPTADSSRIDTLEMSNAIATYIRSLTRLNSRFDTYMSGNKAAMNATEIAGFNLFMGKAKCGTCHYMPLFNGTLPPKYLTTDAEVIGVPATAATKKLDADLGQYAIFPVPSLEHGFKTSTVRNTALTAPYMHNGVFNTLKQVINFYNNGGGAGAGLKVDNQTLSPVKLHLTTKESNELIAFIKSLNSR
jgi:cytochrome c peroxidase